MKYFITGILTLLFSFSQLAHAVVTPVTPTITPPTVTQANPLNNTLTFRVVLAQALPVGYGVFLNFDDQQGNWFIDSTPGGHMAMTQVTGGTYELNYTLNNPGLRSFRAGIFNTQNDLNPANDVLVGAWSSGVTCTAQVCIEAATKFNAFGDPAVTGSGSELFKNVDVANGNYHLSTVDMSVQGKGPSFAFSRAYNSLSNLPNKWTFGYEMKASYLINTFNRQVSIGPREDGHMQQYFKDMDGLWYALNPGNYDQLIENIDGSFVLYTQGNRLYRFASPSGVLAGRLQSIEDRLGNALTFNYTAGLLSSVTDANNRTYTITRDASNRVQRVTDFANRFVSYTYDVNGMITSVRNMLGGTTNYTYAGTTLNHRYRLASLTDSRNKLQYAITYDPLNGRVTSLTDGAGNITSFSYGTVYPNGPLGTGITQPSVDGLNHNRVYVLDAKRTHIEEMFDAKSYGQALAANDVKTTHTYYPVTNRSNLADQSLVTKTVDPNMNSTNITYDPYARGKPQMVTDAYSRVTSASYGTVANQPNLTPVTTVKKPGIITATRYQRFTSSGQAQDIIDPKGNKTTRVFDANDQLISTKNPRQTANPTLGSTQYTYDAFGNVTSITDALGNVTQMTSYDALGRLLTKVSPLGLTTTFTYDANGNVLTQTEQGAGGINYTTTFTYDLNDNLLTTTDPLGNVTTYTYDNLNRKLTESYTVGGVIHTRSYTYDAIGRLATETNEQGNMTQTHYTSRNQVSYKVDALTKTIVTYTYDKNDNVIAVKDAENRTVTKVYDSLNRKTQETDANGNTQKWTYNTAGQVATYTDARNNVTSYTYDAVGNLIQLVDPQGGITKSTYDANGNVLTVTDPNLHTTSYTYDALDRRISTTLPNGKKWLYTYDANGNMLTETTPTGEKTVKTYDALNRLTSLSEYSANGATVLRNITYTYDANNNILSESNGMNIISYTYDEMNRITSVTDQYGKTIAYGYDKAGNRTQLTYPGNKIVQYAYDKNNRLQSVTDWLNKTTTYIRNFAGQIKKVANGNGTNVYYGYDAAGRLTSFIDVAAAGTVISSHALTLDKDGNITKAVMDLPLLPTLPPSTGTMAFDTSNRITSAGANGYVSDVSGRMITETKAGVSTIYNFDINNHITSITQGGTVLSSYGYDLKNNRISQVQNGVETRYVIDQLASLPNVIAETDNLGNITNYYIYGEGLVSQISASGASHYYHYDSTGNTIALSDATGTVTDTFAYAPYGYTTSTGTTHNPFKFVGKYGVMDDGNGLHYMRARYYKEDIKRFVSLDALHGDIMTPQKLNRYAYVLGNPVMRIDPSGLIANPLHYQINGTQLKYYLENLHTLPRHYSKAKRKVSDAAVRSIVLEAVYKPASNIVGDYRKSEGFWDTARSVGMNAPYQMAVGVWNALPLSVLVNAGKGAVSYGAEQSSLSKENKLKVKRYYNGSMDFLNVANAYKSLAVDKLTWFQGAGDMNTIMSNKIKFFNELSK